MPTSHNNTTSFIGTIADFHGLSVLGISGIECLKKEPLSDLNLSTLISCISLFDNIRERSLERGEVESKLSEDEREGEEGTFY